MNVQSPVLEVPCDTLFPNIPVVERIVEFGWSLNYSVKNTFFFISKRHEGDWSYAGNFLYEADALNFFCENQQYLIQVNDQYGGGAINRLVCRYSCGRFVIFDYTEFNEQKSFFNLDDWR